MRQRRRRSTARWRPAAACASSSPNPFYFLPSTRRVAGDEYLLDTPVVRDFVADVRAAIEDAGSPAAGLRRDPALLRPAARRPDWLPERFQERDPDSGMGGGIGQWLLFRAEDASLSLFSLVVPSGAQTPVHDHLAWGLVGLYRGTQDEDIYAAARRRHRARREPRAGARRLLRPDPADRRHPPRAHDLTADVGLDPPAHQRHRLRLAPRLRRGVRRGHAVSLGLRQRALRRGLSRSAAAMRPRASGRAARRARQARRP